MSFTIYPDKKSPFLQCDIWHKGKKYSRSTKRTNRRAAEAAARDIEAKIVARLNDEAAAGDSLALADVAARYMVDVGDHHAGADNTDRLVKLLIGFFGREKLLSDITHNDALELRRWRRQHTIGNSKRLISAYTVNDTIEQLKKLFTYLKASGARFGNEPNWKKLWLDVPKEHPRELSGDEELNLDGIRADYLPLIHFVLTTGKRKTACMTLTWKQVDLERGTIEMKGKGRGGGKPSTIMITPAIRAILWPLYQGREGNAGVPEATRRVFTFVADRSVDKVINGRRHLFVQGKRYPISKDSLRGVWDTWRKHNGLLPQDGNRLRFHDLRHDFASKLLRSIPSAEGIKVVQAALDHADIGTTLRTYSHLLDGQVPDAIERLAQARMQNRDHDHRKNHRSASLKVVKGR